jgi:micrococcal nuclease
VNPVLFPRSRLLSLFLMAVLIFALPGASLGHQYMIVKVSNGDTIIAICEGAEIKVRLAGIDAPELGGKRREPRQPFSRKAKCYLESLVLNRLVEIEFYGLENHDIYLGNILLGKRKINLEMVLAGLAEVDRKKIPKGFEVSAYYDAERNARAVHAGMWAQGDRYVSPERWRGRQRGKAGAAILLYGLFGDGAK